MGLKPVLNMNRLINHIKILLTLLFLGFSLIGNSQCFTSGSIDVSASGFENGTGFSQQYVLVSDATDEILVINTTGSFTSLTTQGYRIYAVNYEGTIPTELVVGDLWADLVANTAAYCINIIGPYDCPEILCFGDDLISRASGYTTGGNFEEKYVVVNNAGNIIATNTTGTFSGLAVGTYTVYAVNTESAILKADIDDLGAWSDISGSTECLQILGPKNVLCEPCTFLPITLLSFNAQLNNNKVNLDWQTANEINNDFFTIERSKDGHEFSPIIQTKGAGNSNTILNYADIDAEPLQGVSYYRLKQTDFDGNYTYSEIIPISIAELSFTIHPNPSKDGYFYINNLESAKGIKVVDALGRVLKKFSDIKKNNLEIDLSNYKKGMYYLVITASNSSVTEKIVIQ